MLASVARVEVKEALCGIKKGQDMFGTMPVSSGWDSPIIDILDCFKNNLVLRVFVCEIRCKLSHSENRLQLIILISTSD